MNIVPKKKIKTHLIQVRLTPVQYKKFTSIASKEGFTYAASLAKQLLLNYMTGLNTK